MPQLFSSINFIKALIIILSLAFISAGFAFLSGEKMGEETTMSGGVKVRSIIAENSPNFSFTTEALTQKIAVGDSSSYDAYIAFLNDFNSTSIDLWTKSLPAGITATYAPNPLPHQGASIFTLEGDGMEKTGTYTFTMGASAKGITHTQDITLIISAEPDFGISISPRTQTVAGGGNASYEVTVGSTNKFQGAVTLSVLGLPSGVSGSFVPNPAMPDATSVFTVKTSSVALEGEHTLTITGTNGSNARNVQAILNLTAPGSAWSISAVGTTGSKNNTVRVGPARNDGINRVYVGTIQTGRIFEFSWDGSKWGKPIDIGGSIASKEIHNMTIGPGRNDGILRIYAASVDGNLYELTYGDSGWSQATVGEPSTAAFHAAVGYGRNDGVNRLYAVRDTSAWEYTWSGADWSAVLIGKVSSGVAHGIALGDGRGDGINYLYVASTGSGVYEGAFSNGAWSLKNMGDFGDARNVNIGAGRDDGVQRVYAALLSGKRMREFTWNGTGWTFGELNPVGEQLVHAYVLPGRGDGVRRLYTSGGKGNAYEFSRDSSSWKTYTLGGGTGYMYGFHFGEGRNDGVVRLYGGSFNTKVYEYTFRN